MPFDRNGNWTKPPPIRRPSGGGGSGNAGGTRSSGLRFGTSQVRVGGVEIDFQPSPFVIANQFDKLGLQIRSFREPLKRSIQQVMAPSLQANFAAGGRPTAWQPLSQFTLNRKKKNRDKILVRSGKLRQRAGQLKIWTIDGKNGLAYIGPKLPNDIWYGAVHQSGWDTPDGIGVTPRQWALIQAGDIGDIEAVFSDWIQERVDATVMRGRY
jgi:phage gpG-like protein